MLQIPTPSPMNVDATLPAAAATANVSTITTSPGGMPVAVIGLKLIGVTIQTLLPKIVGEAARQKKAANANNQKRLGRFSQLNPLVKLKLRPACLTPRA
jgi:hypothetical protein